MPMGDFKKAFGSFSIGMYGATWQLAQTNFNPVPATEKVLVTKI